MPITITPAHASHAEPVQLANTLGYSITARVTVSACNGHVIRKGPTRTLASGSTLTAPKGAGHRVVTWVVERQHQQPGAIQSVAALSSRQGCPAVVTHPALPSQKAQPITGAHISAASHSGAAPLIGGIALILGALLIVAGVIKFTRRARKPRRGGH